MRVLVFCILVASWPVVFRRLRLYRRCFVNLSVACYLIGVLYFTLLCRSRMDVSKVQLQVFWSYRAASTSVRELMQIITNGNIQAIWNLNMDILERILLNILLLMPAGYFVAVYLSKSNVFIAVVVCFGISLAIEIIQYYTRLGWFEIDDLINNTSGGILGYEYYRKYK